MPDVQLHLVEKLTRSCGGCTLCCKLLPVKGLGKAAGERCKYQRAHKGCAVYPQLQRVSPECSLWNCRWLINDDCENLKRPDRSHCVIDLLPDFVTLHDPASGEKRHVEVVQIWVDPSFPDAWREPELRAYMVRRAAEGKASIIRWDNQRAMVVFAPALSANHDWNEVESIFRVAEHSMAEIAEALAR